MITPRRAGRTHMPKIELEKAYQPDKFEKDIYRKWEESGYFNPDNLPFDLSAEGYAIVMPPPNVTGTLHMGHAAMLAIEDILIRFWRMNGRRALWIPGTDHAAIATQTKVEKILKEEGADRHKLGREKFLERVEAFARDSHDTIVSQVRAMGCSCDWSREAYTLDKVRTKAVRSVFKLMRDDGLVYRGERIVNWCPRCKSTLADDEVEYEPTKSKLYTFKYSKDFPIAISTTRPETKLGDTAVAVNPKDKRYAKYIGQSFDVDYCGVPLRIRIIAERNIDIQFGTGAVGVTPAHSLADWQMAEEHDLNIIKVIDEDGMIRPGLGEYSNKNAFEARSMLVEKLKNLGLLERVEEIENNLSLCYRCDTAVEPLPSLQWFIDVNKQIPRYGKSIKELSVEAVKTGVFGRDKISIFPERFEKSYYQWMDNLRDWCVSRQIWFGHRVPVWHRKTAGKATLVLVRHSQTDWNREGIMQGQQDIPLNAKGLEDAEAQSEKLKGENPDIIISSPLARAKETAKLINSYGAEVIYDDRLRERSYGKYEGMKTKDLLAEHPEIRTFDKDGLPYWIEVPTAETYSELRARARNFLDEIRQKQAGRKLMIVSHGDTLDMLYAELEGVSDEKAFGTFSKNDTVLRYEIDAAGEEEYYGIEAPQGEGWEQDPDTLDTWFSSGLWTFSTLARKERDISIKDGRLVIDSDDFARYHPTAVLETGYDILFFWVARMIIMSSYAVADTPFRDVYLHGLVLDEQGKKMSKSKGNVIDPLDMISRYGTDATRLSLVIGSTPGNDLRLSEEKIAGQRNFVNKLWNIARYILRTYERDPNPQIGNGLSEADRWMLARTGNLVRKTTEDLKAYRFSQAGEALREFAWNDLADWYIEASKFDHTASKSAVMYLILSDLLKLAHPFMPFVTEAIWDNIDTSPIMISGWPDAVPYERYKNSGGGFESVKNTVSAIRNARSENGVEPGRKIGVVIYAGESAGILKSQQEIIKGLRTGIGELRIEESGRRIDDAIFATAGKIEIYLTGARDKDRDAARITKEIGKLEKIIASAEAKLANPDFLEKAPDEVISKERVKLSAWQEELRKLKAQSG